MNKSTHDSFDAGKINFIGQAPIFFWISVVTTILAIVIMVVKGFNYGIDFKGGTELQVRFQQPLEDDAKLRTFIDELGFLNAHVQPFGEKNEYLLRFDTLVGKDDTETNQLQKDRIQKLTTGLESQFASLGPEIRRVDAVGPQVGNQLKRNGVLAMFYALIVILIYIGLRFDYNFAPGAVLCLFHDVILVLGIFSLLGKEINVQILAAVLTIIGYDINDTIVVYDRIRENIDNYKGKALSAVINKSTNETLRRTVMTSTSTMASCLALMFIAEGVLGDFGLALLLGIIFGTYSSIYVAAPSVIYFDKLTNRKARIA